MNTLQENILIRRLEYNIHEQKTNHILHLLLSLITAGIWLPIWLLVAFNTQSKKATLERKLNKLLRE